MKHSDDNNACFSPKQRSFQERSGTGRAVKACARKAKSRACAATPSSSPTRPFGSTPRRANGGKANRQGVATPRRLPAAAARIIFAFCRIAKAGRGRGPAGRSALCPSHGRARPIRRRRPDSHSCRIGAHCKSDSDSPRAFAAPAVGHRDIGARFMSQDSAPRQGANIRAPSRMGRGANCNSIRPASRKPRRANDIERRADSKSLRASS